MDLQLDVKGCRDVYESFDKYTAVEMMCGENQYTAEGHGLQVGGQGSVGWLFRGEDSYVGRGGGGHCLWATGAA